MTETATIDRPARSCGDCAMCCKVPAIEALNKPANQWCTHCTSKRGCDRYETRPAPCRNYQCLYLLNEQLEDFWRPNKAHFMVSLVADGSVLLVSPDATYPDAWKREPYFASFQKWSATRTIVVQTKNTFYRITSAGVTEVPQQPTV